MSLRKVNSGLARQLPLLITLIIYTGSLLLPADSWAGRSSRDSIRNSTKQLGKGADKVGKRGPGGVADNSGPRDPRGISNPRGPRDPRGAADPRGRFDPRGRRDPRGRNDSRSPGNIRNERYDRWDDARDDYRRRRAFRTLFKIGVKMASKPKTTTTVVVSGSSYHYAGGVYYVQQGTSYVVVPPPTGAVVYAIPASTTVIYSGSTPYYYSGGTYYVPTTAPAPTPTATPAQSTTQASASSNSGDQSLDNIAMTEGEEDENFELVEPPVGATVPYLPDEVEEMTIGGTKYYVENGTYYRPFASDGDTIYMVVQDPNRAA